MEVPEEVVTATSTEDFLREMLEDEPDETAGLLEYLKAGAILSAVESLYLARRAADKTQADVAQALGTRQPAIARLEADVSGALALRRYAEYALACGKVPLVHLEDVQAVGEYVFACPGAPLTADAYESWRQQASQPSVQQPTVAVTTISSFEGILPNRNTLTAEYLRHTTLAQTLTRQPPVFSQVNKHPEQQAGRAVTGVAAA